MKAVDVARQVIVRVNDKANSAKSKRNHKSIITQACLGYKLILAFHY
jgi:hypothetical protein